MAESESTSVAFRIPKDLLGAIDAKADGMGIARPDAIRIALTSWANPSAADALAAAILDGHREGVDIGAALDHRIDQRIQAAAAAQADALAMRGFGRG